ncbi:MAG: dihydropteroate synthase [Planctomycetota bacterium]|uniref:dihydropteroate synthase n=1 Tax=Patiriisocius sp. Uisw_047 TaxID=3230969 RepID=UPI0039E77A20
MQTINCKGTLIDLSTPRVMGIINVTPDSFYDGGKTTTETAIMSQAEKMLTDGATFLDIGGYSSRPNAVNISEEEEIARVIPAITEILKIFPTALLSIDTFRSHVARRAVEAGACMINDISGGSLDAAMFQTVASLKVPYIVMHMKGTPQNMTTKAEYQNITNEVILYFTQKLAEARSLGINDIIIDPGFGFAKTANHSFELLNNLELLKSLHAPILAGVSRKSMIYKTLGIEPTEALNGTSVLHGIALDKGANIIRVHDVKEAVACVKLVTKLKSSDI